MRDEGVLSESLQHPRRSLGNRHRSQAEKFLKLGKDDSNNLLWAEQSSKQSLLYDFTNEENWKLLIRIKVLMQDSEGARSVLADLFSVLGRDPELMGQLANKDIIGTCEIMLDGALSTDPLDPDIWWEKVGKTKLGLESFSSRLKRLDVSDQRANILYSRRLERVRNGGYEDAFLELSRILLSQRPINHEAWEELGSMYERRGEYDEAWLCYDQAQSVYANCNAKDRFKDRMEAMVHGSDGKPWKEPPITDRASFLDRLGSLTKPREEELGDIREGDIKEDDFSEIEELRGRGRLAEAFFLARRMAAEGKDGAPEIVSDLLNEMG